MHKKQDRLCHGTCMLKMIRIVIFCKPKSMEDPIGSQSEPIPLQAEQRYLSAVAIVTSELF